MKCIPINKLPKFLKVTGDVKTILGNNSLPNPWKRNELVKVMDLKKQVPSEFLKTPISIKDFRKEFVRILRKDENGKFTINSVLSWKYFDLLKNELH